VTPATLLSVLTELLRVVKLILQVEGTNDAREALRRHEARLKAEARCAARAKRKAAVRRAGR
jgi:hypothetical protein